MEPTSDASPADATTRAETLRPPESPRAIDRYHLLERIGEGGMGEVWLAEQQEPVRRRVAVKLIRSGRDSARVIARFQAERQALALMEHPNIARVLDAGTTSAGQPYFVMEHVPGLPITVHCDRARLGTRERLDLFLQVCDGAQHAHHKAVIHRDLKPSNVLVTRQDDRALPKIIDFGVAKAIGHRLTEDTLHTEMGILIGTPEYMSPEQAEGTGRHIDTRTDVYSLGVILYELLSGALPFEPATLRQGGHAGIVRVLREIDPPTPSARLTTLDGERAAEAARRRASEPETLRRLLRGDLDWITMRAIEKDPARRYSSPHYLAEDIRRHLCSRPVLAGPPGALYRAGKFVRRHRLGVAAATVLLLGLGAGLVAAAWGLTRAWRAERAARQEAESSERVSRFLSDLIGSVDPERMGRVLTEDLTMRAAAAGRRAGEAAGARPGAPAALETVLAGFSRADTARRLLDQEILGRAAATIDEQLDGEPLIAARLLETISSAYRNLGFYDAAADHARRALAIRRARLGEDARDTLATLRSLGVALYYAVRFAEAETVLREAPERQRRFLGPEDPLTLATQSDLAVVLHDQNRLDDALALHEPALRAQRRILGLGHADTVRSLQRLAVTYSALGRHDEAERLATEAFDSVRGARGEDHADTAVSMHNLARIHHDAGRHEEAARWLERSLEIRRRVIGEDAVATLYTMNALADNHLHLRREAEAERLHREVLERGARVVGEEHPAPRDALGSLGRLAAAAGRHDEARRLRARHLGIMRRVADARSGDPGIKNEVAALLLESADATTADRRDALAYAMAAAEESGRSDPEILETLARAHAAVGDAARARETVRAALALLRADDQVVRERLLGIIGGDKPVDGPAGGKTGPSRP